MASHESEERSCFKEFVALNRREEEKDAVDHFKPVVGFSSAVERVDPVDFLQHHISLVGTQLSVVDSKIKASFENLKRKEGSPVSYERFRVQLRLLKKVYFAFKNDSSQPALSRKTGLKPLWKYVLKTLRIRPRTDGCKPSISF